MVVDVYVLRADYQCAVSSRYDPVLTPMRFIPVLKRYGGRWDKRRRVWLVHTLLVPSVVHDLGEAGGFDVRIDASVDAAIERLEALVDLSYADAANVEYNQPPDQPRPYPFQLVAYKYGINAGGRCIIADEQGLGKTVEALLLVRHFTPKRLLIVCPLSVAENWSREIRRWLWSDATPLIWRSSPRRVDPRNAPIVITTYDSLHKLCSISYSYNPDMVIFDEAHYAKNFKARRTKASLSVAEQAKHVLALTGTPLLNRPVELWTLWHAVQPDSCPQWGAYTRRYCDAHRTEYGWDTRGASNIDELAHIIRTFSIRRTKSQVLHDLPPIIRRVIPVRPDEPSEIVDVITDVLAQYRGIPDTKSLLQALAPDVRRSLGVGILREYHAHAERKAVLPEIEDYVETLLQEDNSKLVFFAVHKVMVSTLVSILHQHGVKYVCLTGDVPQSERQLAVDVFTNDPDCRVAVLTIGVAREGLNLQIANHAVMLELDWTPGGLAQAEGRIHRIGQQGSALVTYLLYGVFEDLLYQTVLSKLSVISRVVGSDDLAGPDLVAALIDLVREHPRVRHIRTHHAESLNC